MKYGGSKGFEPKTRLSYGRPKAVVRPKIPRKPCGEHACTNFTLQKGRDLRSRDSFRAKKIRKQFLDIKKPPFGGSFKNFPPYPRISVRLRPKRAQMHAAGAPKSLTKYEGKRQSGNWSRESYKRRTPHIGKVATSKTQRSIG